MVNVHPKDKEFNHAHHTKLHEIAEPSLMVNFFFVQLFTGGPGQGASSELKKGILA
jgi:hypothetical protein